MKYSVVVAAVTAFAATRVLASGPTVSTVFGAAPEFYPPLSGHRHAPPTGLLDVNSESGAGASGHGVDASTSTGTFSPDPLWDWVWDEGDVDRTGTTLQVYATSPATATAASTATAPVFTGLVNLVTGAGGGASVNMTALTLPDGGGGDGATARLTLDFAVERAAWFEFDSPDLGERAPTHRTAPMPNSIQLSARSVTEDNSWK